LPLKWHRPNTVIVNVTGCALIGFFGTPTLAHGRYPVSENMRLFVMTGICDGYTTFSAFSLHTLDLLRVGAICRAGTNIVLSVAPCTFAVWMGHVLAAQINGHASQIAQIEIGEKA
jgi:fluoride exporter